MDSNIQTYPFSTPSIHITQPIGEFFIAPIPARILLETAYSHRLEAEKIEEGIYKLKGSQRKLLETRLKQIGRYIDTVESAFPNTIILAANYRQDDDKLEENIEERWNVKIGNNGYADITIPSPKKLAPIIDGQHRLFGFNYANDKMLDFPLVCSVFFDLPKPYQAFLFATINSNQKSVDKSQTYELFGYDIQDEPPEAWTPEKLSVFLSRKLNMEKDSPLYNRIIISAENDIVLGLSAARKKGRWMISTATIVDGILKLISGNPKEDAYTMHTKKTGAGRERSILRDGKKKTSYPLREFFINENDKLIYTILKNYFIAVNNIFWENIDKSSYITKTVGVQALFDILKAICNESIQNKNIAVSFFSEKLQPAGDIDFSDDFFQASGTGKTRIRNCIELKTMLKTKDDVPEKHWKDYRRICRLE